MKDLITESNFTIKYNKYRKRWFVYNTYNREEYLFTDTTFHKYEAGEDYKRVYYKTKEHAEQIIERYIE